MAGTELTLIKKRTILLLISGESKSAIARNLKISRETISRWLKYDIEFKTNLDLITARLEDCVTGELKELLALCPLKLKDILNTGTPTQILKAIDLIFKYTLSIKEKRREKL